MAREISGKLTMLGNSVSKGPKKIYTVIELGEYIQKNVQVMLGLDNYLQRALEQGEEVTLYMSNSYLVGVKLASGEIYYTNVVTAIIPAFYILGVLTLPIFGIGLIAIWYGWQLSSVKLLCNELKNLGAISV